MLETEKAKATDSDEKPQEKEPSFLAEYWELARLPVAFALVAILVTWLIWYFTTEPCAGWITIGCRSSGLRGYVNIDFLNKAFIHAGIVGGFGSIGSYIMLTRERREKEAANTRAVAAEQRAERAEQRAVAAEQRASEERQRASEERQEWLEEIRQLRAQVTNGNHTS